MAVQAPEAPSLTEKTGKFAIEPRFKFAKEFKNGLAPVQLDDDKWGFIDVSGKLVIPATFDGADQFSEEGLASVSVGDFLTGRHGFIDKAGKFVINPQYEWASNFHEKRAAVRFGPSSIEGKWGFIDTAGKLVIPAQFDEVKPFSEGMAAVRVGDEKTGKWGFIDLNGKYVLNPRYDAVRAVREGLFVFFDRETCGRRGEHAEIWPVWKC